jgi:small subunit ribosomal protein S8e
LQQTRIGEKRQKFARARGGDRKVRLLRSNYAAVTDPTKGKTARAKILDVIENPANPHYVRQNIVTRGAVIETDAGRARVTSRPGQHGVISAVLITD